MEIESWPVDDVTPYPGNPRVMRDAADRVAKLIKRFGFRQPIVVDSAGVIVIGHTRLAAAKLLGLTHVPVHRATELTEDEARSLRIADNRSHEYATWDTGKLDAEIKAITGRSKDLAKLLGYSSAEVAAIDMQARADVARLLAESQPKAAAPTSSPGDWDDSGAETGEIGPTAHDLEAPGVTPSPDAPKAPERPADMVPFNVLLPLADRAELFDVVRRVKERHGLKTTAEALMVIVRGYKDA